MSKFFGRIAGYESVGVDKAINRYFTRKFPKCFRRSFSVFSFQAILKLSSAFFYYSNSKKRVDPENKCPPIHWQWLDLHCRTSFAALQNHLDQVRRAVLEHGIL